jgi:hypothetical protein
VTTASSLYSSAASFPSLAGRLADYLRDHNRTVLSICVTLTRKCRGFTYCRGFANCRGFARSGASVKCLVCLGAGKQPECVLEAAQCDARSGRVQHDGYDWLEPAPGSITSQYAGVCHAPVCTQVKGAAGKSPTAG